MASSMIRKAIGAVKDQTSISLAKVSRNVAPDLEVLIVKATSHENEPADEKYIREILNMLSHHSRGHAKACVSAVSKRLSKTRDWVVALKALMLVHRLLADGDPVFAEEMVHAGRGGAHILNMSEFRDYAHSGSWDHTGFIRNFALYLDQKLEFITYERKSLTDGGYADTFRDSQGQPKKVLERLNQLMEILICFLASKPRGAAKDTEMVLVAMYLLVKDSFKLYADIINTLEYLLDCFSELEYVDSVMAFDSYVRWAKMIDELVSFYEWCKDIGLVRSSEFPEEQKISDKLLGTLEGLLREKGKVGQNNEKEIKALPPPEDNNRPTAGQPLPGNQLVTNDLVNLKDDKQEDSFALFFDKKWVQFPNSRPVMSDWQNPKAGWELALVDSESIDLSKQEPDLAGGFDLLLLDGMYDQRAKVGHSGSASSAALPTLMSTLALPEPVGQQDPFAASLSVPPPTYVQMADMERKQQLLEHEQRAWEQYAGTRMGLASVAGLHSYYEAGPMQYPTWWFEAVVGKLQIYLI